MLGASPVYEDHVRRVCHTAPYCVGYSQDALGDTSGKAVGITSRCENTTLVRIEGGGGVSGGEELR